MAGDWTTDDLAGVLSAFAANMRDLVPAFLHRLRHAVLSRMPQSHDNTIEGARENIHHHYDLSNDLFKTFLDESLTYSSAVFNGEPYGSDEDLADAQRRKIDRLLDSAGGRHRAPGCSRSAPAGASSRSGRRAAARRSPALTISTEQAELARERIAAAGLTDRVDVLLQDYREAQGTLRRRRQRRDDRGGRRQPLGRVLRAPSTGVLAPGGRVGLQAILQDDYTVLATRDTYTWIRKYIFPGGQLASVEAIERTIKAHTALRIADRYSFGRHYAETLRRWRARFEEQLPRQSPRSASTRRSAACGRSTSPTPRRASAPATSTSRSSP